MKITNKVMESLKENSIKIPQSGDFEDACKKLFNNESEAIIDYDNAIILLNNSKKYSEEEKKEIISILQEIRQDEIDHSNVVLALSEGDLKKAKSYN